jgi:hypothetical protein
MTTSTGAIHRAPHPSTPLDATHAGIRARRRYGITLDAAVHDALLKRIRADRGVLRRVYLGGKQRWICALRYNRRTYNLVVDHALKRIITFLPPKNASVRARYIAPPMEG